MSKKRPSTKSSTHQTFVLAHDAGGAEILAAFIRAHTKRGHFVVCAGGPARAIFRREHIPYISEPKRTHLQRLIRKYRSARALFGTGGPDGIEFAALQEAKRQRLKTTVYIDSWTNYRERFGYPRRGWQKNLPDEVWAGDSPARSLAKRFFKGTRIRLVPNQYFATIANRFRRGTRGARRPRNVLYMSAAGRFSEKFLASFLTEYSRRKISFRVRVRMHPENDRARYERIIRMYGRGVRVELSREKSIVDDLLRAHIAVGPETNALVTALLSGIRTIRIVPPGGMPFLPFKKITRVKSAKAAVGSVLGRRLPQA